MEKVGLKKKEEDRERPEGGGEQRRTEGERVRWRDRRSRGPTATATSERLPEAIGNPPTQSQHMGLSHEA